MTKRLEWVSGEKLELEVYACECGFHLGLDSSYLEQVGGIRILCPGCGREMKADGSRE